MIAIIPDKKYIIYISSLITYIYKHQLFKIDVRNTLIHLITIIADIKPQEQTLPMPVNTAVQAPTRAVTMINTIRKLKCN